jgi:membrane-associated phospholipid phosphatase
MKRILVALIISLAASTSPASPAYAAESRPGQRDAFEAAFGPNFRAHPLAPVFAEDPSSDAVLAKSQHRNLGEITQMVGLLRWNAIAINTSGLDHTPVRPGESRVFGEQLGPHRSSRAMAIVHIAIFDAINAIHRQHHSYSNLPPADPRSSMEAAIAHAAHDTLVALYPSQRARLDAQLAVDMFFIRPGIAKSLGVALGRRSAQAILNARAADGSAHAEMRMNEDYIPGDMPGIWRQDPISLIPLALGARWMETRPFVIPSASHFRVPPPPSMDSPEYTAAYNEVLALGGDGIITPTQRSPAQTQTGIFWAYDGTPSLCAPPRLYNQVTVQIALQQHTSAIALARLLALVNTAMADAGISAWESKYHYAFWRPVAGVRESDIGSGSSGLGDGNPDTHGDASFTPLGAPASNLAGPNFTPPFPAYPSGHATFGGALFETLRLFYGRDDIPFVFISDEFNGSTVDNQGNTRPFLPRLFRSFSEAEEENGQSRIYLGIHWSFDKTAGIDQGRQVANHVYQQAFQPLP